MFPKINQIGEGWRLPSTSELEQIYKQLFLYNKGNLVNGVYWSGNAGAQAASLYDFSKGMETTTWDHEKGFVRLVKDINLKK